MMRRNGPIEQDGVEGLVADPAVRVLIDTSLMTGVSYDPEMSAFAVEAGTTLGEVYRKLFLGWGVTIPAGESPDIGVGGHVLGGAFDFLWEHGLAADLGSTPASPRPA